MEVRKQQLELDMEQQTGSKLGKEYKAVYFHPAYLTYMHSMLCKMPGYMHDSQAGFKIAGRNNNNLRYADGLVSFAWYLMAEIKEELKSLLLKVKEKSEKAGWKLKIRKTKIMASSPITSW